MRCTGWLVLMIGTLARASADDIGVQGFESWRVFESPAGNRHLEAYVKNGWLGERPPYVLPAGVDFQMGPARLIRRSGPSGQAVVDGKYALGVETVAKPVNILTGVGGRCGGDRRQWRLAAWLKGQGSVRFRVYEYNRENRAIGIEFFYSGEASRDWQRHEALFEPTRSGTRRWSLVLEIGKNAAVDVDAVSVRPAAAEQYVYPSDLPRPVPDAEKVVVAFPVEGGIRVDGSLDEPDWRRAEWQSGFLRHKDQSSLAPVQAQFAFAYDSTQLYFAFATAERAPTPVEPTPRGAWPRGNAVEFFLDPGATRDVYHQFAANVMGCTYESRVKDASWDCDWHAKGAATSSQWCVEAAIPFAGFGRSAPTPGETWSVNVCRNGPFMGPWSPVGIQYHSPEGFGILTFGTYEQWWRAGVGPRVGQRSRQLRQAVGRLSEPDAQLQRQLGDAEGILKMLGEHAGGSRTKTVERAEFLGIFRGAEKVRRTLENVADELRWITAMQ